MNKKTSFKNAGIVLLGVFAFLIFCLVSVKSVENKAIGFEESISESKAAINKEERRRIDLFRNMVDTIENYNKYEKSTMKDVVTARSQAAEGNVEGAAKSLNVVVEKYPELKSTENYGKFMKELSNTENVIAGHRGDYNWTVKKYKQYIRKFPNKQLLSMQGYEKIDDGYLVLEVDETQAVDLFGKK